MHRIARHGRVHLGDAIFKHIIYFLESTAALLLGLGVVERAPRGDDLRDRRVAQARLLVEHDLGHGGHGELGIPVQLLVGRRSARFAPWLRGVFVMA